MDAWIGVWRIDVNESIQTKILFSCAFLRISQSAVIEIDFAALMIAIIYRQLRNVGMYVIYWFSMFDGLVQKVIYI